MSSSFTVNLGLENPAPGDQTNTWGTTENNGRSIVDNAVGGFISISVAGNSNVALTFTQGSFGQQLPNKKIILTGALTGSINVVLPNGRGGHYIFQNSTSGAFTITLGNNNGSGAPVGRSVVVAQGQTIEIFSDGTNVDSGINSIAGAFTVNGNETVTGNLACNGTITQQGATFVTGPGSSVSGDVATFSGTTGQVIQDSGLLAANIVTGPASATNGDIPKFNGTSGKILSDGFTVGTAANNLVQLDGSAHLPAVDGSALTGLTVGQVSGAAPLASPTFTGTPAAPTPATADNTTKIATTAFVKAQGYLTAVPSTFGAVGTYSTASSTGGLGGIGDWNGIPATGATGTTTGGSGTWRNMGPSGSIPVACTTATIYLALRIS